jgi:hypothetical protein
VTGLLSGLLIGFVGINALVSYRIDSYQQKIITLQTTIEEDKAKYEKLKKSVEGANKQKKYILRDIEINLTYVEEEEDELDKIALEKNIKEKYKNFLGVEVKNIDTEVLAVIVDKDIVPLEDKKYRLKVNKILLSEILKIWISVTHIK